MNYLAKRGLVFGAGLLILVFSMAGSSRVQAAQEAAAGAERGGVSLGHESATTEDFGPENDLILPAADIGEGALTSDVEEVSEGPQRQAEESAVRKSSARSRRPTQDIGSGSDRGSGSVGRTFSSLQKAMAAPQKDSASLAGIFDVQASLPDVVMPLLKAPFLSPVKEKNYAKKFLRSVGSSKAMPVSSVALKKIKTAAAAFQRVGVKLGFQTRLFGPLKSSDRYLKKEEHAVFLGVYEFEGKPAGFFGYVVQTAKDGVKEGEIHSAYFNKASPAVSGIAKALLSFTASTLGPALGVRREVLRADYAGRYVWAKTGGFKFNPNYRYYDIDDKRYKTWELAQRSLARFLKANHIRLEDLRLRGKPVPSLEALTTPADFASLDHRQGRKVRLRPLVNQEVLGAEAELHIGKAFMLASYLPKGAPYVLNMNGHTPFKVEFARDAMPWWFGYRDLPSK